MPKKVAAALVLFFLVGCSGVGGGEEENAGASSAAVVGQRFVIEGNVLPERAGFVHAASGSVFAPSFKKDAAGTVRGVVFYSDLAKVQAWDVTGASLTAKITCCGVVAQTPVRHFRLSDCASKCGLIAPLITSIGPDWLARRALIGCSRQFPVLTTSAWFCVST